MGLVLLLMRRSSMGSVSGTFMADFFAQREREGKKREEVSGLGYRL